MNTRRLFLIFWLAALFLMPGLAWGQLVPPNSSPCSPQMLGLLQPGNLLSVPGSNEDATNDPFQTPACGSGTNTVYYGFALPTGYSGLIVHLQPIEPVLFHLALYNSSLCSNPSASSYFPGASVCATSVTQSLILDLSNICLPPQAPLLLRVGGMAGMFHLTFQLVEPNCQDGCQNGNEIFTDVLYAPLFSNQQGRLFCPGDSLTLTAIPGFLDYTWPGFSIDSGRVQRVGSPGTYYVFATNPDGCLIADSIVVSADSNCVWPGDVDQNGLVEARDILPLGLAYGQTGPIRLQPMPIGSSTGWNAQPGENWNTTITGVYNSVDLKHLDCNGDGVINFLDAEVVDQNYGLSFAQKAFAQQAGPLDPPLFFAPPMDTVNVGDTVTVTIHLGTQALPVNNFYGYSFGISLDFTNIDTSTFSFSFIETWTKPDTQDILSLVKPNFLSGWIDVAYTRTNHIGVNGFGPVASLTYVMVDDLAGKLEKFASVVHEFTDVLVLDDLGFPVYVQVEDTTLIVKQACISKGLNTQNQWIQKVCGNTYCLTTGNNNGYFETTSGLTVQAGGAYTFTGFPGSSGPKELMHWRVWIDYNRDGDLTDDGEMVFEKVSKTPVSQTFTIPPTASAGQTTLRVQMKKYDGIPMQPCEVFTFGEVEDYTITVQNPNNKAQPAIEETFGELTVLPNPARDFVFIGLPEYLTRQKEEILVEIFSMSGQKVLAKLLNPELETVRQAISVAHIPGGIYQIRIQSGNNLYSEKLVIAR